MVRHVLWSAPVRRKRNPRLPSLGGYHAGDPYPLIDLFRAERGRGKGERAAGI
jgi:hypothetical protein